MTLEELVIEKCKEKLSRIYEVLEIFTDFFGKEYVDLQRCPDCKGVYNIVRDTLVEDITDPQNTPYTLTEWSKIRRYYMRELPEKDCEIILAKSNSCNRVFRDFSNPFILVWFPHVTITNEHDRSTTIDDLYAKVCICFDGSISGKFTLNRATYTTVQMQSDYMHSHVCRIPKEDFTRFQDPCTGDGPINSTISNLNIEFDEDIWKLFCLELSKYVTVESISGTPYHYLEQLGTSNMSEHLNSLATQFRMSVSWTANLSSTNFKEFMTYIIKSDKLKYGYSEGAFVIGLPYIKTVAIISNLFIEWYNKVYNNDRQTVRVLPSYVFLLSRNVLLKYKVANNKLYQGNRNDISINSEYIGMPVCTFKGQRITLHISDITTIEENETVLLNPSIISFIIERILLVLNYKYKYGKDNREERGEETTGIPIKRTRFL